MLIQALKGFNMKEWLLSYKKTIIIGVIVAIGSAFGIPQAALQAVAVSIYDIAQKEKQVEVKKEEPQQTEIKK